ncbi:MAG TPA: hypothetical protein VM689_08350 [Aliidongia sp.]|nr:hypothetical protein [Aliidongia sp.]
MSISSIAGSSAASSIFAPAPTKPQQPTGDVSGTDDSSSTDSSKKSGGGGGASSSKTITNETTQTNSDGSITTIITYSDGTTSDSTVQAAPQNGKGGVPSLLDPSNSGQNSTLLAAQENSKGSSGS